MSTAACLRILCRGLGALVVAGALAACTTLPEPGPEEIAAADTAHQKPLYVIGHGWHTGVVVSGAALNRAVPQLRARFGEPAYYEVGWGDAAFYQSEDVSVGLALQALFLSQGAVLHVVAVPAPPRDYFKKEKIVATCIGEQEEAALIEHIAASFERSSNGDLLPGERGNYGDGQFYRATGHYSLANTCNTWTARSLNEAGLPISPYFKQTAAPVLRNLRTRRTTCPAVESGQ